MASRKTTVAIAMDANSRLASRTALGLGSGTANVDFSTGLLESVLVTIADANVATSDLIIASVTSGAGRDDDEMEMEQFSCSVVNIIANTSFDVIVTNLSGGAHDVYKINYIRSAV